MKMGDHCFQVPIGGRRKDITETLSPGTAKMKMAPTVLTSGEAYRSMGAPTMLPYSVQEPS